VLSDEELITEIRSGSQAAMEMLVKRHYAMIFSYIYRKIGNHHTAYDLTQEVFIKMMQSLPSYQSHGKFEHWLLKIAVNHCLDYYRSKQYRNAHVQAELDETIPDAHSNVWDLFQLHDQQEQAKQAVLALPEHQREAIILNYYHGLKVREIADVTGANESTIKSRIRAGISRLKKMLLGEEELSNEQEQRKQG